MPTLELLGVVLSGLVFLLLEEFRDSPIYALSTVAVAVLVAAGVSRLAYRQGRPILSWCLIGAFTATLAAILRPALLYGGYVSYLNGVNCFARLGLDNVTYVLFGISGAVAGAVVARRDPRGWLRVLPLLGIVLGVLYHYNLAQGWWSSPLTVNGAVLLSGEFLGPTVYAWLMTLLASRFRSGLIDE